MAILDAMSRFDGNIDAVTFWICQAILIGATLALIYVLTNGRAYQDGYATGPTEQDEYFWVVILTNAVIAYPTLAVVTNRLNAIGWSENWAWAVLGIIVLHALAQKLGLNGAPQQPSALGWCISIAYLLGLLVIGI